MLGPERICTVAAIFKHGLATHALIHTTICLFLSIILYERTIQAAAWAINGQSTTAFWAYIHTLTPLFICLLWYYSSVFSYIYCHILTYSTPFIFYLEMLHAEWTHSSFWMFLYIILGYLRSSSTIRCKVENISYITCLLYEQVYLLHSTSTLT